METELCDDGPKEACGVFGIYAPELPIAPTVSLALIALQHRGQEGCGVVTYDPKDGQVHSHKGLGLVSQVFSNEDVLKPLTGVMGVGHTRYSTAGRNVIENIQPDFANLSWTSCYFSEWQLDDTQNS